MMVSPFLIGDNHDNVLVVVNGMLLRLSGLATARPWNRVWYFWDKLRVTPANAVTASTVAPGRAMFGYSSAH